MGRVSFKQIWLVTLLQQYSRQRLRLLGAVLFTLASALLALLLPLVFSFVVDSIIGDIPVRLPRFVQGFLDELGGRSYLLRNLWLPGLVIMLITGIDGLATYCRGKWISYYAETGALRMRQSLFDHMQALPFSYHARAETGDLIQRCTSDVETIRRFFHNQILEIVRSVTLILTAVFVMLRLDVRMALIGLAVTPVIFITSAIYFRKQRDAFQKWDESEGQLSTVLQEYLTGIRVVKAFARQDFEKSKFGRSNTELREYGWKMFTIIANFWMFSDLICLLQVVVVTVIGTLFVINGHISLGQLVVFISYTEMLLYPLRGLARIIADAGRTNVAWQRVREILQEPEEPDDSSQEDVVLNGQIEFRDVSFAYANAERPVLKNINLLIRQGETVGILGPTGAGKSSLLYLLQRLYEPDAGQILLDDLDIRKIKRSCVRQQIGFILQEPFVFSRTVLENIRLPRPDATSDEVHNVARTAALHEDIMEFEQKYDTMVGERGVTLSGGQKQRLTIARTLIRECPVLIFDDSLSAVDTDTDLQIRRELATRKQQATTLLVSHRISTLADADRVIVLENGRITQTGPHGELIRQPGLYRRVYEIQSGLLDDQEVGSL